MQLPPFNEFMGTKLTRIENGEAEMTLELQPEHLNLRGVAHGGVTTMLLDSALGAAVIASMPSEWWCATLSLNTEFLRGPTEGLLTARGRVVRRGRSIAFASGEIVDERNRLLATASGTWRLWSGKPGAARMASDCIQIEDTGEELRVGKILAIGRNYAEHNREMGYTTSEPVMFLKPTTALAHNDAQVQLPRGFGAIHHEVELVVVIGRSGRNIPQSESFDHIAGYAVGLDLTLRDLQGEAKEKGQPWTQAKGFDQSAPVSLAISREKVGDIKDLAITLEVNGELRQSGNTSQMLRSVDELVSYASRLMTLQRGDLLFTGTPAGVGPLVAGDTAVGAIEGVGRIRITAVESEP